ncbi:MAG: 2Fe-2S iron-sulfur cluster-binding protein [Microscillaceae bacterium]|jgi:2Fe-2S ferredoxin|nr:2Fe-2S iron-sulfur cluster-binding protein [Microscillaceae bacterium]
MDISITVIDKNEESVVMELPTDMSLKLMEVLKGEGYPILATCGGMALCATCHVQVLAGYENLAEAQDQELDMLDTIPNLTDTSRLACQIPVNENLNGAVIKVLAEDNI